MSQLEAASRRLERAIDDLMSASGARSWGRAAAGTDDPVTDLSVDEACQVSRAIDLRQREFAAGRRSAKAALQSIGMSVSSIPRGLHGAPVWPTGATGSISHDGPHAVTVAVPGHQTLYGLDFIDAGNFFHIEEVLSVIRHPRDEWIGSANTLGQVQYFAAKEVAVKIMSPVLQSLIAIEELQVSPCQAGLIVVSSCWPHEIVVRTMNLDDGLLALGCSAAPPDFRCET